MRFIKLSLTFFTIGLFLMACGSSQTDETVYTEQNPDIVAENEIYTDETDYVAKDNLDLEAVGDLLQRADNAEEFEYLLNNNDNGVNNLDLNGDGYTDYLSVAEYDDNYDNQRGFTIFDRFGPNEIQEIASIIFDRDRFDAPGARILLRGNEQIYGDDNYYETNWLEKSLAIASWVFNDRNDRYESPYYYENYPEYYETYRVVETPVYRTRVREYYPERVFIRTNNPTITNIRIKSSYKDKSIDKIYAKLAKPTREQKDFRKNNPRRPEFVQIKQEKIKVKPEKIKNNRGQIIYETREDKNGKRERFESRNLPNRSGRPDFKPNKPDKTERKNDRPNNFERKNDRPQKEMKGSGKGRDQGKNRGNGGGKGKGKH